MRRMTKSSPAVAVDEAMSDLVIGRFHIRPEPRKRWFFRIFIFRDRETMHQFRREQKKFEGERCGGEGFAAEASHWRSLRIGRTGRVVRQGNDRGQAIFYAGRVGSGIVSHEMTHLAVFYLAANAAQRGRRFDPVRSHRDNERLAYVQGDLVHQFWRRFYARKLEKVCR